MRVYGASWHVERIPSGSRPRAAMACNQSVELVERHWLSSRAPGLRRLEIGFAQVSLASVYGQPTGKTTVHVLTATLDPVGYAGLEFMFDCATAHRASASN